MFGEWKLTMLALMGGLLGWAFGKILDKYLQGRALYLVIVALAVAVIVLMQ